LATPLPLAIGLHVELQQRFPDVPAEELKRFLSWWTRRNRYRLALRRGGQRRDLDGVPAGEVSPAHQGSAKR
jgi:sRNA-binding protein